MCFNYISEGAVGGGWVNDILGEEEIEKRDEFSDKYEDLLSDKYENLLSNKYEKRLSGKNGAVGGCCEIDRAILGEEEIEKRDEISENVDNRFIWTFVWFAWIGLVYWEVVSIINKYNII